MKFFLLAVFLIFAILGLADFLHFIVLRFMSDGERALTYSVLILRKGDPEKQLCFAAEQMKWNGRFYADGVIALGDFLEENERNSCVETAKKYNIIFCSAEELKKYV